MIKNCDQCGVYDEMDRPFAVGEFCSRTCKYTFGLGVIVKKARDHYRMYVDMINKTKDFEFREKYKLDNNHMVVGIKQEYLNMMNRQEKEELNVRD